MSGEAAHLLAERRTPTATIDQSLSRFDIFPRMRFPFTKWQFLTISTSAAFRETYWTEQRNTKTGLNLEDPINRNYYDLAVQITGPIFSRIFNRPGSGYAEKLKHSIEPFFNVERISPIDDFSTVRAARWHRHDRRPVDARSATASRTASSASRAAAADPRSC